MHIRRHIGHDNVISTDMHRMQALNMLKNTNKFYISNIGIHKDLGYLYKYGITSNLKTRMQTHRRIFDEFNLKYLAHTNYKELVENEFERAMIRHAYHHPIVHNGKRYQEIFRLENAEDLYYVMDVADMLVDRYHGLHMYEHELNTHRRVSS
jgi:hypothetical protein